MQEFLKAGVLGEIIIISKTSKNKIIVSLGVFTAEREPRFTAVKADVLKKSENY